MPAIPGGSGADSLTGTTGADTITGAGGNDTLEGRAGADTVYGGDGNDFVDWRAGQGEDALTGEVVDGGAGFDVMRAIGGGTFGWTQAELLSIEEVEFFTDGQGKTIELVSRQFVRPGGLAPTLNVDSAAASADTLHVFVSTDARTLDLRGLTFQDWTALDRVTVTGSGDRDTITGSTQADTIFGGLAGDSLHGWAGDDVIFGGAGNDTAFGGAGDDLLIAGPGIDSLYGGAGFDRVDFTGLPGPVVLDLEKGRTGVAGAEIGTVELALLGAGHDTLLFTSRGPLDAPRALTMDGGAGTDRIELRHVLVGTGSDNVFDLSLVTFRNVEELVFGFGASYLTLTAAQFRGPGALPADLVIEGSGGLTVRLDGGTFDARGFAFRSWTPGLNDGHLLLQGTEAAETIFGSDTTDLIQPGGGADRIRAGAGDDFLRLGGSDGITAAGEAGNDIIAGGAGNDRLQDGLGSDRLTGGGGRDEFFIVADGTPDTILDWRDGLDVIRLQGLSFGALTIGTAVPGRVRIGTGDDILMLRDRGAGTLTATGIDEPDFLFV